MKNTMIISGFPGVGKSHLFNNNYGMEILDSDSSEFSWNEPGVRNPEFPQNYINHIKENIGKVDIILVSSHDVVRQALKDNNIYYILIYPSSACKAEYANRYAYRGSDPKFIQMMNDNWDKFIDQLETETFPMKIILDKNQYLGNLFTMRYCSFHKELYVEGRVYNCKICSKKCKGDIIAEAYFGEKSNIKIFISYKYHYNDDFEFEWFDNEEQLRNFLSGRPNISIKSCMKVYNSIDLTNWSINLHKHIIAEK